MEVILALTFGPEPSSGQNPRIVFSTVCLQLDRTEYTIKLFLETTDRLPIRPAVFARWVNAAKVCEAEVIRIVTVRSNRPIATEVTDIDQVTIDAETITRRRIPDSGSTAKPTCKIHPLFSAVI